jgi:hypothetical protein
MDIHKLSSHRLQIMVTTLTDLNWISWDLITNFDVNSKSWWAMTQSSSCRSSMIAPNTLHGYLKREDVKLATDLYTLRGLSTIYQIPQSPTTAVSLAKNPQLIHME